MMKRRILSLALALMMLASALCGCADAKTDAADGKGEDVTVEESEVFYAPPGVTLEEIRQITFDDVAADSIYRDAICYMAHEEVLIGNGDGTFGAEQLVSRAAIATALYRMSGENVAETETPFTDVAADAWYAEAAAWCAAAGIINGTTPETFSPNAPVTRMQMAAILYRAAQHMGYDVAATGDLSAYRDAPIEEYAQLPLSWVLENGFYRTMVADTIQPYIGVSRAQMAQAFVSLKAVAEGEKLAKEIHEALPQRQIHSDARPNHDTIQAAVDAAARKYGAAGVQVAVVEDGVVTDTFAYGWATKNSDPMTADHKMRVASISKVVVGMTAQLLREDGIIDLDADISNYWGVTVKNPKYPNHPITTRSMLSHTSSIFNAGDDVSRAYSSVKSRLQGTGFSSAVPGSIGYWSYNNYAYGVLGMTLELAAGRIVDDILQEKLYTAMGIDAAYASGDIRNTAMLTTIYRSGGSVGRSVDTQLGLHNDPTPGATGKYFAGGLTISAADLGKLIALLAEDGCYEGMRLLKAESVELMESRYEQAVPGGSYQALPLRYWPDIYGREGVYYHTGSAYGVFNCASYDPLTGDGVVVLTSGAKDEHGIYKICAEINNSIYGVIQ